MEEKTRATRSLVLPLPDETSRTAAGVVRLAMAAVAPAPADPGVAPVASADALPACKSAEPVASADALTACKSAEPVASADFLTACGARLLSWEKAACRTGTAWGLLAKAPLWVLTIWWAVRHAIYIAITMPILFFGGRATLTILGVLIIVVHMYKIVRLAQQTQDETSKPPARESKPPADETKAPPV